MCMWVWGRPCKDVRHIRRGDGEVVHLVHECIGALRMQHLEAEWANSCAIGLGAAVEAHLLHVALEFENELFINEAA